MQTPCHSVVARGVLLSGKNYSQGGAEVAKYCSAHICKVLKESSGFKESNYEQGLRQTFLRMDELLRSPGGQVGFSMIQVFLSIENVYNGGTRKILLVSCPLDGFCNESGGDSPFFSGSNLLTLVARRDILLLLLYLPYTCHRHRLLKTHPGVQLKKCTGTLDPTSVTFYATRRHSSVEEADHG